MLLDGEWCRDSEFEPDTFTLKLGDFFLAVIKPGKGDLAGYWVVTLNGKKIGAHREMEWAKGCAEREICSKLSHIRETFRVMKARAPTSSDLYQDGGWARFKTGREKASGG